MATPEKYKHINFKPPQGARDEAEKSLAWRREFGRGGTAVGIARARDLANGVEVSPSTVRRMKAFFDRHQKNKSAPGWSPDEDGFPSNSRIAWAMWGSDAGWSWAKKVVEQMNAADEKEKNERGLRPYGSTHGMRPKVYVVHGAPCSGKKDYVASHMGENDVVFDYDKVMAAISGRPIYQPTKSLVSYCLDIRTLILKKAMRGQDVDKTWIITTRVGDEMKSQLSDIPVEYVHIDTPKDECLQRLESDPERQPLAEELRTVIDEYFSGSDREEQRRAPTAQPGVERRFIGNFSSAERLDPELLRIEKRADPETGKPRTYLIGYAARFHRDSLLLGDFVERIDPGAFDIVLDREDADGKPLETRCLFNHDPNHLLGRFPTTMRMVVDDKGLRYECLLPESRKDIEELCLRGDLKGSSFSFVVAEGGERWTTENGQSIRLVTKIKSLLDCGPVTYPAYGDASVEVVKRSYEQFIGATKQPAAEQRKQRLDTLAKRAEVLRQRIAAEAFLAERRDCGRGEDGKFGSGNKCQEDEDEGEGESDRPTKSSSGREKAAVQESPTLKDESPKYMELSGPITPSKAKAAQKFIDSARKGQLERGGKDGGKADDGSGVQTWSKGDNYPWTTKQVGDSEKGGYVQGIHPDGSKTEKYKFPAGSDASEAYKQAEAEIKKKTMRSLRAFLEARR
jgi:HK97 family phage prohead protease